MTRLHLAPDTGAVEQDGIVYVAALPDGPILVLDEVPAAIWATAQEMPAEEVARHLADLTGEDLSAVQPGVTAFLDDLVRRGLLVPDGQ
ncbi:hypothetical protein DY023_01780 [Microbacterium bovistercoris]|uniref:PqqD family protein n=1 Tax=Microbacterium bovistercoris TaxID=2293570 RepID=A0A371NXW4_9MICO|nr:PqqD family peptide modification chaperone [Microbacterium bovistercoris]REJ08018.1 hypothetical protein DY023_01780 [Microbacterium bovistercoris]